jgi:hypothetical protein
VVAAATLAEPVDRLDDRLAALHRAVPMTGGRLHGEVWYPGSPPEPLIVDGEPLNAQALTDRFDLAAQPPLRVVVGSGGHRLAVACHHAAFDGLGLLALLTALVGVADQEGVDRDRGDMDQVRGDVDRDRGAVDSDGNQVTGSATLPLRGAEPRGAALDPARALGKRAPGGGPREGGPPDREPRTAGSGPGPAPELRRLVGRLVHPADRVAPSLHRPGREALAVREVDLAGAGVTARLVDAAVAAAGARNERMGRSWRRVGVNVGLAGPEGESDVPRGEAGAFRGEADPLPGGTGTLPGNFSRYRRLDLTPGEPAGPALAAALASPREPLDQVWSPRFGWLLEPVVGRFSDSLLVSNLGRREVPGVTRLDFFPVARGRSAVAVGAVGLAGGAATVSVRARDLSAEDAEALLADLVARLAADP